MPDPVLICANNISLGVFGLPEEVKKEIQVKLSYYVPGFKYMPLYKQQLLISKQTGKPPAWDGTKSCARRTTDGGLRIPSGLLSYVREVLEARGIPWTIRDERNAIAKSLGWSTEGLTLWDFQGPVKDKMLSVGRGIVKMATGAGKGPTTIAAIIEAAAFPAIFYVTSCDLLEQMHDMFAKYCRLDGKPVEIGRIGGGHCDIRPITVATVQSCQMALEGKFDKFDDEDQGDDTVLDDRQKKDVQQFVKEAQFAVCDEVQHSAADTIQAVMNNSFSARYRFGLSASPWRDDEIGRAHV